MKKFIFGLTTLCTLTLFGIHNAMAELQAISGGRLSLVMASDDQTPLDWQQYFSKVNFYTPGYDSKGEIIPGSKVKCPYSTQPNGNTFAYSSGPDSGCQGNINYLEFEGVNNTASFSIYFIDADKSSKTDSVTPCVGKVNLAIIPKPGPNKVMTLNLTKGNCELK